MNKSVRGMRNVVIAAAVAGALCSGAGSWAQQAPGARQQAVGTWAVVSQYVEQPDGKRLEPFGSNPKGMVLYDANGRFMLIIQRASLPRFASNNRLTGTTEENQAVVQGSIAYYGTYSIDEADGTISLHYEGSTYPNWDGDNQKRLVSVSGDELRIISPFTTVGGGKAYLVLKRLK